VNIFDHVCESIYREDLLRRGEAVVLGVSGGVDSMVLLEILRRMNQWKLHLAHFNHCLRGAESDADEAFVQSAAERLGRPFSCARDDVKARAAAQGVSIEMAAREMRHAFLAQTAEHIRAERIVLAHHANDQVETFWLRLLRGDVGPGLAGMRWKRPVTATGKIQIVRPLLDIEKSQLLEFARKEGIEFREDSSNASSDVQRNRLRLEIIPQLEKFQPALQEITWRDAEVLAAEKEFLEAKAREWIDKPEGDFLQLHKALQREIIRLQFVSRGVKPSQEIIEKLRLAAPQIISFSAECGVIRDVYGRIRFEGVERPPFVNDSTEIDLRKEGSTTIGYCIFQWRLVEGRGPAGEGVEYFDAAQLGRSGIIRYWQAGDRFQPIGMAAATKLQDLFTNAKVPAAEKRRRLVAVDSSGKIFWAEGLRISELHKVTPRTTRVLEWKWRPAPCDP
jgi:tRNA(Ile)-lysidine synthase